jgi:cytochrome c553
VTNVRRLAAALLAWAAVMSEAALAQGGFVVPDWAYPINPPVTDTPPPLDDRTLLHVPDSRAAFTRAQVKDLFAAPDWHPDTHPPMPDVVARGRKPSVYACGYCHLPDGTGRPENASLAGLPAEYITAQVAAFRSGTRRSASQRVYLPADLMRTTAESATDPELQAAAAYFSGLRMARRVRVIEVDRVPAMRVAGWLYVPVEGGGPELLGQRIIEVPIDPERHELRDSQSGFLAYVPPGSITRGERIASTGGANLPATCATCHGAGLRGVGLVPPIAGRSPTYMLRQLVAFRTGARSTEAGRPMQQVVEQLDVNDMIAVAAYVGSLEP